MSCKCCAAFLHDFLNVGFPNELSFNKQYRKSNFEKLIPEVALWIVHLHSRVPEEAFLDCYKTSCRIARRGRKEIEYEELLLSATLNLLRFRVPWLTKELNHWIYSMIEGNVFIGKKANDVIRTGNTFLSYLVPKSFLYMGTVHEDHIHPKGLSTNVGSLLYETKDQDEETLYDRDDYQKEILEEDNDGLYI